jgi:hypothetical protein
MAQLRKDDCGEVLMWSRRYGLRRLEKEPLKMAAGWSSRSRRNVCGWGEAQVRSHSFWGPVHSRMGMGRLMGAGPVVPTKF